MKPHHLIVAALPVVLAACPSPSNPPRLWLAEKNNMETMIQLQDSEPHTW